MQNGLMRKHRNLLGIGGWTNSSRTLETRRGLCVCFLTVFFLMKRNTKDFFCVFFLTNEMTLERLNT